MDFFFYLFLYIQTIYNSCKIIITNDPLGQPTQSAGKIYFDLLNFEKWGRTDNLYEYHESQDMCHQWSRRPEPQSHQ